MLKFLQGMIKPDISYTNHSLIENIMQWITHIIGISFSYQTKIKWYNKISQYGNICSSDSKEIFISNDQYNSLGKIISKHAFTKSISCDFEGRELHIMQGWEELLIKCYGKNYMMLPPEEKRVPLNILAEMGNKQ